MAWIAAADTLGPSEGLTSFTEPGIAAGGGIGHGPVDLHAFQLAVERGLLHVRATVMPHLTVLHDLGSSSRDAIDRALDAFAAARAAHPRRDVRHRVEPFAVATDAQVKRLIALGAIAVPQGRFLTEIGDGLIAALGPERSERCYRMRSLTEAGAVLPGSDAPVAHGSPLPNIDDMVNRRTASEAPPAPREAVTAEQALRAYTVGSAYAEHAGERKGRLARGMPADFAVLSDDLLAVAPDRIASLTVGAAVIGGEMVYDGGALA
ncbi:amidohydrolase family protein [Nonomuraea gerenzanensis]|uniref:Exoenzymes regulatory protein AepA n=1 Tax=Nonomuraea gerenzanensis TaxID=93944 RepID=A0A1M4EE12_9ACTN|nr:amidohydrolase family protein [Nonomuraea gerenzanensis]UBU08661.1 amidohydrolase family protein [Nonomuraea gerenzanensis]SBO97022.1 Exoenzymes regulatory protein AepA precursor [Nonomuraea gerenzanensis]